MDAPFKLQVISTLGTPNPTQASKAEFPTRAEVSLEITNRSGTRDKNKIYLKFI